VPREVAAALRAGRAAGMFKPAPEEARLTQAIEIAAAAAPAAADRRGYRREIDGLRAVAVLPVMLFHAGFAAFAGGWLGVDVFFVISGYLITGILARELAEGRFSIARFYERRARRILPALVLVLLACVPFALALMSPPALEGFSASFLATVLSVSNVWFWTVLDYFGPSAEHLPLLHTWTLGVEEQFYLLFPPILALLWRWRRGSPVVPLALLAALSLGLAVWAASRYPSAGFFLLPFRGWELATGALLALAATPGRARGAPAALGLALIVAAIALAPRLPGVAPIVLAVAGSGLVIRYAVPGTAAARLLSHPHSSGSGSSPIPPTSGTSRCWSSPASASATRCRPRRSSRSGASRSSSPGRPGPSSSGRSAAAAPADPRALSPSPRGRSC